jgi:hypothetical protein
MAIRYIKDRPAVAITSIAMGIRLMLMLINAIADLSVNQSITVYTKVYTLARKKQKIVESTNNNIINNQSVVNLRGAQNVELSDSKSGYRKVVQVRFLFWAQFTK